MRFGTMVATVRRTLIRACLAFTDVNGRKDEREVVIQMQCDLRRALGLRAECDKRQCTYWTVLGSDDVEQCAVEYFGLVGGRCDWITNWLYDYKVQRDLERMVYNHLKLTRHRLETGSR
ncbi:MAG: hypothetical protein Q8K99_12170 [Actinomycetota bacterium]|nr:hypothetical protein [Actinomycetota bacterium]